jgi:non-ribosomal peptide synthase protein (TIGR01720 family)
LSYIDLAGLTKTEQTSAIETIAGQLQPSLNLAEGPIVRVALFDLGADRSKRLLFIAHHLGVDAVSWRILLEDLQTAYEQLSQNGAIRLPAKTTSYKHWAEQLAAYAQSATVEGQLDFWLAQQSKAFSLPLDFEGINTAASFRRLSVSLSAKETQFLLREVPKVYQTQINDVLLTALAQAFSGWTRAKSLLIDLEGHGREEIMEDLDLSRTVGWFTTVFPVWLEGGGTANPGAELKKIKEQLRRIPQGGIGYGLLRYLNRAAGVAERLRGLPQAQVSFVYLGRFDQMISASSLFGPAPESSGPTSSAGGTRRYVLEVSSLVAEGRLQITWAYSQNLHRSSTVERLADNFLEALRAIVAHCHSPAAGGYTPSDFPEAELSQKELDELLADLSPVE